MSFSNKRILSVTRKKKKIAEAKEFETRITEFSGDSSFLDRINNSALVGNMRENHTRFQNRRSPYILIWHGSTQYPCQIVGMWGLITRQNTFPEGCDEIWYNFAGDIADKYPVVLMTTVKIHRGHLRDMFHRTNDPRILKPEAYNNVDIVTACTRDLNKVRFQTCEYFIPEPNFLYVSDGYR